jgi:nicotinamidase-related amidase
MTAAEQLPRSPELMSRDDTGLLVVDVQEKLISLVPGHERIVWNIRRLIDGASLFKMPVLATEHYPKGLSHTTPALASRLPRIAEKTAFSCVGCEEIAKQLEQSPAAKWLVVGIETHVCVQQTVFDLMANGFRVYLAVDAVGSR